MCKLGKGVVWTHTKPIRTKSENESIRIFHHLISVSSQASNLLHPILYYLKQETNYIKNKKKQNFGFWDSYGKINYIYIHKQTPYSLRKYKLYNPQTYFNMEAWREPYTAFCEIIMKLEATKYKNSLWGQQDFRSRDRFQTPYTKRV